MGDFGITDSLQSYGRPYIIGTSSGSWNKPEEIKPKRTKVIPSLPSDKGKVSVSNDDLLRTLLNVNPGVFIGDSHTDFNCSEFMTSKMAFLKQQGVTLFFMEMFGSEAQPKLDRYFEKGDNGEELVSYLQKRGWEKRPGMAKKYFEIVRAARENGIKIIGIDNNAAGKNRLEKSNPHWVKVISNYTSNNHTKYVVFGGQGHSSNYLFNKGVDFRLGIPSIDLETGTPQILLGDGRDSDFSIILEESPNQTSFSNI